MNEKPMTSPLDELKVRARLQLNARRAAHPELRLRDCLHEAARGVGFAHWEHARRVLGGMALPGDDMGTFWHAPRCDSLLSAWFTAPAQARAARDAGGRGVVLPYRRQFVLAGDGYLRELGLDPQDPAWAAAGQDLVQSYGTPQWLALVVRRLKAPRASFIAGPQITGM